MPRISPTGPGPLMNIARLISVLILLLAPAWGPARAYQTGGTTPLPAETQAILDEYADLVSLGFNTDWVQSANLDPVKYTDAIARAAEAVREGEIPGVVLHIGTLFSTEVMPIAIGHLMVDPEKRRAEYDTRYYLEDLTAPLSVVPLLLAHCQERGLPLETRLETIFPQWKGEDRREVTIESVLRHSTGLPASWPEPVPPPKNREEIIKWLHDLELAHEPDTRVVPSRLNHLLAGMILEKETGKNLSDLINAGIIERFSLPVTSIGIMPAERSQLAPGAFSARKNRFLWGEVDEPLVGALGLDSAWAGLVSNADEVAAIAGGLLLMAISAPPDVPIKNLPILYKAFRTDPSLTGGESMGLGYEIGRYTPGSFGWDGVNGSSFWVLPEKQAVVVLLSNMDHPGGMASVPDALRREILDLMVTAIKDPPLVQPDAGEETMEDEAQPDGDH